MSKHLAAPDTHTAHTQIQIQETDVHEAGHARRLSRVHTTPMPVPSKQQLHVQDAAHVLSRVRTTPVTHAHAHAQATDAPRPAADGEEQEVYDDEDDDLFFDDDDES